LISIGWFFIWGPYAILIFVELIVGDALARKIQGKKYFDGYNRGNWLGIIEWQVENTSKFFIALKEPLI
jgi:hypothetical protein